MFFYGEFVYIAIVDAWLYSPIISPVAQRDNQLNIYETVSVPCVDGPGYWHCEKSTLSADGKMFYLLHHIRTLSMLICRNHYAN